MTILDAVILAIIQGLTEFLPVSSSGHLVLGKALLGGDVFPDSIAFEVVVHLGTFLAVIFIFFQDIRRYLGVFLTNLGSPANMRSAAITDSDFRFSLFMLIGMIPAGVIGILFQDQITHAFQSPLLVAVTLIITGLMLLATRFISRQQSDLTAWKATLIGLAQALALLPGISRSGSTISTALFLGISQEQAARFSFLMVLPLIAAATGLEIMDLLEVGVSPHEWSLLVIGFAVSFIVGWISLKWLLTLLKKGKFHYFAWYCFAIALSAFVYFN